MRVKSEYQQLQAALKPYRLKGFNLPQLNARFEVLKYALEEVSQGYFEVTIDTARGTVGKGKRFDNITDAKKFAKQWQRRFLALDNQPQALKVISIMITEHQLDYQHQILAYPLKADTPYPYLLADD